MSVCPFANQSHRYDSKYPQYYRGGPNKGVLHTTETSVLPGYAYGGNAPHFSVLPIFSSKSVVYYQHYDTDRPSRALVDLAGGVQTNNDGVIQIELIGTCTKSGPGMYWPDAPQWAIDGLLKLMQWINKDRGIPMVQPKQGWLPYPSSYGNTSVRMSQSAWDKYAGWCGHQHVPENLHGDPGDMSAVFKEADMPDPRDFSKDLYKYDTIPVGSAAGAFPNNANDTISLRTAMGYVVAATHDLRGEVAGLSAAVEALATANGADPKEIADIVAKAVRERLALLDVVDKNAPSA